MKTKTYLTLFLASSALGLRTMAVELSSSEGPFKPNWQSLESQYQTPEWFRDAKFGIWAHWGSQCEPEAGDWYARNMYIPGHSDYKFHVEHYGHQATNGFKDVIHAWQAANFNPFPSRGRTPRHMPAS